ncbi:MAG: hypothetical protein OXC38_04915 [Gammaproteobacteria bacterium]|nr:hypothetical protein [Gammaproteobacteria bacterium]
MAAKHANPGEIVDLKTWGNDPRELRTQALVKTEKMELIRLFLPAGKEIPNHKVRGPITLHCVQGKAEVITMGASQYIAPGQLLFLMPEEIHSVQAVEDTILLLTIIF